VISSAFQPTGGSYTVINILDEDFTEEVAALETTHSGSGGIDEAIAGILKGRGSVHANIDLALIPWNVTPGIRAGAKGLLKFGIGSANPAVIPIMILTVGPKGAVNGKLEFSFGFQLSGDAGSYVRAS
jgi:hypothetical protein